MIVIPVYDRVITPHADVYFAREELLRRAGRPAGSDEKVVFLMLRENTGRSEWNEESFYPIGVTGVVNLISQDNFIGIRTMNRVNIDSVIVNPDRSIDLTMTRRTDILDLDETESYQKLQALKKKVIDVTNGYQWGKWTEQFVSRLDSIGSLAAFLSPWINITIEERYAVLQEDSEAKRTQLLEKILYEYLEVAKLTGEAQASQEKQYQDIYRENAIKKQMEYLQKELNEMHPENVSDADRFAKKIAESGMNDTARAEAEKVLNRLRQEGQQSQESGMLYDYLDFVTGLCWKAAPAEEINLAEARKILDEDHSGLKKVKKRILQQIAVMNLKHEQQGSILLFVGAPGTGKTSIGRSIARALGRKYVRVSLGGVRDEADIRGHRRTYIGALPGRIMDGIQKSGASNPVMVLDEVDKLSMSYNGDPASALLEVLDPEQNNTFTDHYMNVPYDLSNVMFICTANTTDTIPEPLLNRMEVIQFPGYTPDEKLQIAKEHLVPKSMEATGIPEGKLEIPDGVLSEIISDYTREAGVRGLRKRIDSLTRNAAVRIASGDMPESVLTVTHAQLREDLDMHPMRHDRVLENPKPGVVTGLAWTQAGGEILYIETLFTKGSGRLIITGQLGDVMKESAQIAVSLVKSLYPDKAQLFIDNDLHIHVPEGATPKDGPSAGVALTTALASLVTGISADPTVAMTGEVALRGSVTAIGGLPEKLLAAQRAGVRTVFIPKDNTDDLADVADEVKSSLTIVPVEDVKEILTRLGLLVPSVYPIAV